MKRNVHFCLIFILSVILNGVPTAAYEKPIWNIDQWWDLFSITGILFHGQIPGDLTIFEDNIRYHVTDSTVRSIQHGSQTSRLVYVIEFSGLVYGSGNFAVDIPFPVQLPVRLDETLVSGEVWVDVTSLALVRWDWSFADELLGKVGNDYEPVGSIDLTWAIEYDPPVNLYSFPLEIGDDWQVDQDVYLFGEYTVLLDSFGQPQEDHQIFDEVTSQSHQAQADLVETVNDLPSVHISFLPDVPGQAYEIWYSWDAEWNARMSFDQVLDAGVFVITSRTLDVEEYGFSESTPQPTRTPVPATHTPTPRPPTPPPPTPTGTIPTPTPTYTLPPWIPPTLTPTPGPPTQTPLPPDDRPSIRIQTNQDLYHPFDYFELTTTITNPTGGLFVMEYIIFEYANDYWFWPSWEDSVDGIFRILSGQSHYPDELILSFVWPDIEIPLKQLTFWALLTKPSSFEIVGEYDHVVFGYEP